MITTILYAAILSIHQGEPTLLLADCTIPTVPGEARCGTFTVPEDRSRPNANRISLRIIVLRATGANPAPDPVVPIPGGPGGAVTAGAATWARVLAEAREQRAILLVDPRGTGASGELSCDLDDANDNLGAYVRDFLPPDRVRACRAELERRTDLSMYSTEIIARDLDDLRVALGIDRFNLYGVSGGTRQAQIYQRMYPRQVRSMILAGVVAHGFRMPLSYARDAQRAFDLLARDCSADARCRDAYPDVRGDLGIVLERLSAAPARVAIPRAGRAADTAVITRDIFAEKLRSQMYTPVGASRLPLVLRHAATGDFMPFVRLVLPNLQPPPPETVAMGHFLAITCTEDVARINDVETRRETANTFLGAYRVSQQVEACKLWPRASLSRDHFSAPSVSRVPTLFISGDADPVTPPRWAELAAGYLPNSAHLVFPHGGHVPFATPCATRVVAAFLRSTNPASLDITCATNFARPPFALEAAR
jgi:pimeloyl-ACP methyl ester carboxylesterase